MNTSTATALGCRQPLVATPAARPQTQVECFLSQLRDEIDQLDKAIALHSERINPVLRVECSSKDTGNAGVPPEEMLCGVADNLRTQCKRINGLRRVLESLTERTEA